MVTTMPFGAKLPTLFILITRKNKVNENGPSGKMSNDHCNYILAKVERAN